MLRSCEEHPAGGGRGFDAEIQDAQRDALGLDRFHDLQEVSGRPGEAIELGHYQRVALADELQCDVAYLLGQTDRPYKSETLRRNEKGVVRGVDKMLIQSRLSNEWKPLERAAGDPFSLEGDQVAASNVYSLPDYLTGYQRLEFVEDEHAAQTIPKGAYLHTLGLSGLRSELNDGDLVIVSRQALASDDSGLIQRSCRMFRRLSPKEVWLDIINPSLREPPIRLMGPLLPAAHGEAAIGGGQSVFIEALVLRAVIEFAGPPVFSGLINHLDPAMIPTDVE